MSGRIVGEILKDRLEDARPRERQGLRSVLVVLAEAAGHDGLAWPSNATIADRALISERQVVRLLHRLEGLGRITAVGARSGGRARTTRWAVHGSLAEAVKGDTTPPIDERERVTREVVKGDTQMSPEPYEPFPPTPQSPRPSRTARPPAPSLPGLGRGEEGLTALGGPRAAGRAWRSRRRQEQEAETRRQQQEAERLRRDEEIEQEIAAASSPEALAMRAAMRERWVRRRDARMAAGAGG